VLWASGWPQPESWLELALATEGSHLGPTGAPARPVDCGHAIHRVLRLAPARVRHCAQIVLRLQASSCIIAASRQQTVQLFLPRASSARARERADVLRHSQCGD